MAELSRLLRPDSVVYIGGSQIAGSIRAAQRAGYEGSIHVVNPVKDQIEGVRCVPSIADLPLLPDAAVVGLSAERSITTVAELAAAGCGGAVVMVAGFAELNTDDGRERQQRLVEAAGVMPLLGPNCMGLMNQFSGAFVWGDDNHCERQSGDAAAIISQSGALLIGMTGVEVAFPLGYAVSVGNQSVTTTAQLIDEILKDERIKAIGLYLEGMNDGDALGSACYRALKQGVPVIALKGGDHSAGESVAKSHTASMVVERDLWNAFKHRYGIQEVSSPKALVETLKLLTVAGVPDGAGSNNRLSIISYSGGLNGLAATRCAAMGLQLNRPTPANTQWLQEQLPETVAIANPLDLNIPFSAPQGTISMLDTAGVAQSIIKFAEDVADQLVFFIDVPRPGAGVLDKVWCDSLDALIEVRQQLGIPVSVAGILPGGLPDEFCQRMQSNGIACLQGYSETMEALAISVGYAASRATLPEPAALLSTGSRGNTKLLNEDESKRELTSHGLQTPEFAAVTVADAMDAARRIGFPLVCKVLSNQIAHKAAVGGVKLGINSTAEFQDALKDLCADVAVHAHAVSHVFLEQMVQGAEVEVILGIKHHAALGFALMIGMGGTAVEDQSTFETLLLPYNDDELDDVLIKLGLQHHVSADALRAACYAVVQYAVANKDSLATLDVNPLILTNDGQALAADALIVLAD